MSWSAGEEAPPPPPPPLAVASSSSNGGTAVPADIPDCVLSELWAAHSDGVGSPLIDIYTETDCSSQVSDEEASAGGGVAFTELIEVIEDGDCGAVSGTGRLIWVVENDVTKAGEPLTVRCTTYGTPSTAHQLQHAHRYLSGERRRETAERVEDRGAYRVSQDMLMQAPDCELADGNITEAPPRHILRQAAHERRVAERHSTNWTEDLAATMAISRAEDLTSKVVKGGIHLIGRAPVVVHLYREHFFRRYHLAPRTLHLDATGSVTRQVGEKRPYLYALIAESPDTDRSFPLAHLLAESHNVPTIAHFLAQVAHGYKLVTRVPLTPPRVVTDFSWALIHAVSEAIVKTTTEAYLEACWQSLTDPTKQPKTLVSLCGAHLLHSFAHTLKSKGVAAEARPGFMWLFASMQQATSLQTLDTTYKRLCVLALSRSKCAVELPEVTRVDYGTDDRQETEAPLEAAEDAPARRTYRARTAFGRHFEDITNGVKCSLQTDGEASDVPNNWIGASPPPSDWWHRARAAPTQCWPCCSTRPRCCEVDSLAGSTVCLLMLTRRQPAVTAWWRHGGADLTQCHQGR
ncbi:hypothetical protein FJT64_007204 [Amphibalanus amphitrite]|uniref:MULE transposase domain-containing protein n=1 Tax=Amphibalanus amphitrite TaxID=1232801 RepID=A0A6A4VL79_AMPAM|nr:hypothetical protein FJT64_007204 [Amphibalanus amphitrite]